MKEDWANGAYTVTDLFTTALSNARAQMGCEVIDKILNLDFEDLTEGDEGGK